MYSTRLLDPLFHGITLKPISNWFLAFGTALLQINSEVYQYALKKLNSLAYTRQNSPNLDKPLLLNSFVLHRTFKAVQCSVKLKPFGIGPFKNINRRTEVAYELLTQDGNLVHLY